MRTYPIVKDDVGTTYEKTKNNSLTFENICNKYSLTEKILDTSRFDLKIWENPLMESHFQQILESSDTMKFDSVTKAKVFYKRPKALSIKLFNTPDLWYLILHLNGYKSIYEFENFTYLIVPDINSLNEIVNEIEFEKK